MGLMQRTDSSSSIAVGVVATSTPIGLSFSVFRFFRGGDDKYGSVGTVGVFEE
jgi:hypothetical protein